MEIVASSISRSPGISRRMAPCDGDLGSVDPEVIGFARIADERLREDPEDVDAMFVLAASRMACGHLADAAKVLRRLLEIRADYPGFWQLKATVHDAMGEHWLADACAHAARRHMDS